VVLAAAAAVVLVIAIGQLGGASSSARVERTEVTAADGVVQSTITGTGDLEPVTDEDVDFETSGTLKHVDVKAGQHVHQGELLATLDDGTAALTLKQARATLAQARTTLTSDETSATVDEGTSAFVAYSPPSTTMSTPTVPTATATTTTSATQTTNTTTTPPSSKSGTTTVTETVTTPAATETAPVTETSRATETAPATETSPATDTATTTAGAGSAASSGASGASDSSSSATVTAATIDSDKLAILQDEATVREDEVALRETRLRAPVSGTITSLESLAPGDSISSGSDSSSSGDTTSSGSDATAGSSATADSGTADASSSGASTSTSSSPFAVIDSLRHLSMTVSFTESDISELKVGQAATVSLDALSGVELAAKVTAVSSVGTTSDDVVSYDATLTLEQHDARVKPGMSASATVIIKQGHGVTVPSEAVSGSGTLATVKELAGGKTRTRKVIVGIRGDSRDLIVSGVKSGATLVETMTLPAEGSSAASTTTSSSGFTGRFGGSAAGGFGGGTGGPPSGGGGLP
jgi:HlyD family secretion protein